MPAMRAGEELQHHGGLAMPADAEDQAVIGPLHGRRMAARSVGVICKYPQKPPTKHVLLLFFTIGPFS
jgi:hypothetical protein